MMDASIPILWQWVGFAFSVAAGGVLAAAGTLYSVYRWCFGPKFRVGVPPTNEERMLRNIPSECIGRRSITAQFRHRGDCLARPIREKRSLSYRDKRSLFSNGRRCRRVTLGPDRTLRLPVIIENYGRRVADRYVLGISFLDPRVRILDILTEGARIDTLYVARPDLVEQKGGLSPVNHEIVEAYNSYLVPSLGDQYGDIAYLVGTLDGWMFEMVLLKLSIEEDVTQFAAGFSINWSDGSVSSVSKKSYFQGFVILD